MTNSDYNMAVLIMKLPAVSKRRSEMRRYSLLISIVVSHHLYWVLLIIPGA